MDWLRTWDHNLFHAINNLAGKNFVVDSIAIFLAGNVFLVCLVGLLVAWWFWLSKLRPQIILALGSALISRGVIVELLKRIINRPRPYEALANIQQLFVDTEHGLSFPSGHTVIFFSLAFAFWNTKYFWGLFALATTASVVRVFVGVHYPVDILASVAIAALTVWALRSLFRKQINKNTP
jgi:undecaprenyl-diphosphatase